MTPTQAASLNNKIALKLKSVGQGLMPLSTLNSETIAWDYMIAGKIESYGRKSKEVARDAAIEAGVMFNHEKHPLLSGEEAVVYKGDVVGIRVAVKEPGVTFDHKTFRRQVLELDTFNAIQKAVILKLYDECHAERQ